jgi:hypothetical protein
MTRYLLPDLVAMTRSLSTSFLLVARASNGSWSMFLTDNDEEHQKENIRFGYSIFNLRDARKMLFKVKSDRIPLAVPWVLCAGCSFETPFIK